MNEMEMRELEKYFEEMEKLFPKKGILSRIIDWFLGR